MYRGKDPQKSRAPMSFIELYHYGLISHRLSTNSTSKCCIVEKKEITSFEFQSQVSQLGGTTDVWQNIRCSSRRVSFFFIKFFTSCSRPQRPRSFWSAPRIATSGEVQHRKSVVSRTFRHSVHAQSERYLLRLTKGIFPKRLVSFYYGT